MEIQVLRIIEDALIGGRNGEMAYIENNPFIANLFREYMNNNSGKVFRDFLKECLNKEDCRTEKENNFAETRSIIKKSIKIDSYSPKFKEYKEAEKKVINAEKELRDKKKELAESLDEVLPKISSYEIKYHEYWQSMEFKIFTEEIENKEG